MAPSIKKLVYKWGQLGVGFINWRHVTPIAYTALSNILTPIHIYQRPILSPQILPCYIHFVVTCFGPAAIIISHSWNQSLLDATENILLKMYLQYLLNLSRQQSTKNFWDHFIFQIKQLIIYQYLLKEFISSIGSFHERTSFRNMYSVRERLRSLHWNPFLDKDSWVYVNCNISAIVKNRYNPLKIYWHNLLWCIWCL